jgi:hypothetical protein
MALQNRKTLKEYFKAGNIPSENNFSDLIDSMVNIRNDGIHRSQDHGFHIETTGKMNRLLSFFRGDDTRKPVWVIDMDTSFSALCIKKVETANNEDEIKSLFLITNDGKIGINKHTPLHELDVNGTVCCSGRIGNYSDQNKRKRITADGEWHELLGNLSGCHAYEIVAGVGKEKTGKYALMHAIAINIFGKKGKIRYTQSTYMSRNDSIRLKWVGNKKGYALMIRTMSDYGSTDNRVINIKYSITRLWFDETMKECLESKE